MARHHLNAGYNTFLEIYLDVCSLAKLVDLHFRQRMKLKFNVSSLLFWSTFWLMDKVTKFSTENFPFVSEIIEAKDHVIRSFKWQRIQCFNNKQEFNEFLLRLFNELVPLFFHPNYSPDFRPQPRLLKHGQCLFLAKTNTDRV